MGCPATCPSPRDTASTRQRRAPRPGPPRTSGVLAPPSDTVRDSWRSRAGAGTARDGCRAPVRPSVTRPAPRSSGLHRIAGPEPLRVGLADVSELIRRRRRRGGNVLVNRQGKAGGLAHLLGRCARVQRNGSHPATCEIEDAKGGDQRCRTTAAATLKMTGRGDVVDPLSEPSWFVLHDEHGPPRQRRNVAPAAAAWKTHQGATGAGPGGVEIAKRIDLGTTNEAEVYPALLQQAHHIVESEAGDGAGDIGWIAHGVDEGFGRPIPDDAVLE